MSGAVHTVAGMSSFEWGDGGVGGGIVLSPRHVAFLQSGWEAPPAVVVWAAGDGADGGRTITSDAVSSPG